MPKIFVCRHLMQPCNIRFQDGCFENEYATYLLRSMTPKFLQYATYQLRSTYPKFLSDGRRCNLPTLDSWMDTFTVCNLPSLKHIPKIFVCRQTQILGSCSEVGRLHTDFQSIHPEIEGCKVASGAGRRKFWVCASK